MEQARTNPKQFIERKTWLSLLILAFDWSCIVGLAALSIWAAHPVVYVVCVWLIGSRQFAIGEVLLHEASHHNLFRQRRLNDWLQFLYGFPVLVDVRHYREDHLTHHAHTLVPPDTTIFRYSAHGLAGKPHRMVWLWLVRPVVGYSAVFYLFFHSSVWPGRTGPGPLHLFWAIVIGIFAWFGALHLLLLYWVVPLFWCFASYLYWSEVTEHFNVKKSHSRTNVSRIWNLLHHNLGYHYVHHQYPTIPWYRLPSAHRALCPPMDELDSTPGLLGTLRQFKDQPREVSAPAQ